MTVKSMMKVISLTTIMTAVVTTGMLFIAQPAYAKEATLSPNMQIYTFEEKNNYEFTHKDAKTSKDVSPLGTLKITGDAEEDEKQNGFKKLNVSDGDLIIEYDFKMADIPTKDYEWHLVKDSSNTVGGQKLSGAIKQGAVLVQTSLDGINWINNGKFVDYFSGEKKEPLYTTSEIQLLSGCYYRIVVAYKERINTGDSKILFISKANYEYRKIAEVYTFYAINEDENSKGVATPKIEPRQELGTTVNAGHDTGYSKRQSFESKDVHYGWDIGTFTINGYTQKQEKDGTPVFLKNVGDQVTLWFRLEQDIDKLNGKDNLIISEDANGYDEKFQTKKTNMGHGTLIIQYTDCDGHKHDPVIYTDYLSACSTTSADTRVVLYEEGDYEVALDYEIKHTPRKIGPVEVIPEYHDYRTSFVFSVHNGNAMLYPFDIATGSELLNRDITPNGFKIDLANSKDLDVFVTQKNITVNSNGKHVEDSRGEKAAKDGAEYTKPGVYTIKVKNTYTDKETTKTIYIGDDLFLKALAGSGLSVKELDAVLDEGYTIDENGSLIAPVNPEAELQEKVDAAAGLVEAVTYAEKEEKAGADVDANTDDALAVISDVDEEDTIKSTEPMGQTNTSKLPMLPIAVVVIVAAVIAVVFYVKKKRGNSNVGPNGSNGGDQ